MRPKDILDVYGVSKESLYVDPSVGPLDEKFLGLLPLPLPQLYEWMALDQKVGYGWQTFKKEYDARQAIFVFTWPKIEMIHRTQGDHNASMMACRTAIKYCLAMKLKDKSLIMVTAFGSSPPSTLVYYRAQELPPEYMLALHEWHYQEKQVAKNNLMIHGTWQFNKFTFDNPEDERIVYE
jgi:hypothetical protein